MERIASFCVDHTTLLPGIYLSRCDGVVITWDIRMKRPNQGDYLSPPQPTPSSICSRPMRATAATESTLCM